MKWPRVPLSEVATLSLGKMLDEKKNRGELLPYLANVNVRWGEFSLDDLREMRFEADDLERCGLQYGDIVMCEGGEPGRCAIWKEQVPQMLIQKALHRIRPLDMMDARFLFYSLTYLGRSGALRPLFTGATIKHLPREKLELVEVPQPTLPQQRRVADVLSAYDDLIANNQRRITLLEEAARQLYREWFVRLRFPGAEHTIVVDGLPEGWQEQPLGECVRFRSGGTPNKARGDYWEGDIPWASSGELTQLRLHDTELHVSPEGADAGSRMVPANTILAVVRGMSLAREFRLSMTAREMAFNQDLKALICQDGVDPFFLFFALVDRREYIRDLATEAAHGTKKLEMSTLERVTIKLPTPAFQQLFRDFVDPLMAQWDNLTRQNARLRTARDLLLPRLMSGQLTI